MDKIISDQTFSLSGIDAPVLSHALQCAAGGVTSNSDNIFIELVTQLAKGLNIKYAFVAELIPDKPDCATMIAVYQDGEIIEGHEYTLEGTPCKDVMGQQYRYYPSGVQHRFSDPHAKELQVEGYAAIPLFDSQNRAIGLMAAMDTRAFTQAHLIEWMLKIFSVRAAIELERLYIQKLAQDREQQYQTLFSKSVDGLVLLNPDGEVTSFNPAWAKMHGYRPREIKQQHRGLFIPQDSEGDFQRFISTVNSGEQFQGEAWMLRRDGTRFWAEIQGVPMDYRGQPHLLAIVRDVTERKAREQALKDSEERLRATVDAALDCIVSMDQHGKILDFNPAAERTFAYGKEQVLGCELALKLIPERLRSRHQQGLQHYLANGQGLFLGRRIETIAMRADGSEFEVELAIDVADSPTGKIFVAYLRDITQKRQIEAEHKRLEEQLRQAQKMEAIGQLAGGIAHDFNNILTTVMGYIVMAQQRQLQLGDEKMDKYLDRISKAGSRARDLIQQMLTFSRGKRGRVKTVDLAPIVGDCVKLLESSMPSSLEMLVQCQAALAPVEVDPLHLEQVLMNLCINARDASRAQGELLIRLDECHTDDAVCSACGQVFDGDFVRLAVSDRGQGMSPETIARIFEPFYTTKEPGKGTGMGLATAHGIVHEYGGHMCVQSQPGQGSCFEVYLPVSHNTICEPDNKLADSALNAQVLTGKIMLVEDQVTVAEFMLDLLVEWGLQVDMYRSGTDALQAVAEHADSYDLVISDQTMPKMNGTELAAHLYQRDQGLPVILYTGYSETLDEHSNIPQNVMAVFTKPLDVAGFYTAVQKILDKSFVREQ